MTQRKYREVTEADIGERIEVTDDYPGLTSPIDRRWHKRTLKRIDRARFRFQTDTGSVWKYARIEVTDDPT